MMKNKSIAFQIWSVIAGILLVVFICLGILFTVFINSFFTNEMYKTIEYFQENIISNNRTYRFKNNDYNEKIILKQDIRSVNNIIYPYKGLGMLKKLEELDEKGEFLKTLENQINSQQDVSKRYRYKLSDSKLYYVIKKVSYQGKDAYLISFMFDTYRNKLSTSLLNKLFIIATVAVGISLIISLWFSKYLTEPLKMLEGKVKKIAKQDWYEPLNLNRRDEVGSLAESIENMRVQLVQRDNTQQNMLQQISHELKTPIMVIRSYAQAVYDGIFPKGDLKGSMQVIDKEAERLEKRVKDLLYLSKLQYIRKKNVSMEKFNVYNLILNVVDKFKVNNTDIMWKIQGKDFFINGDKQHWNVVFENILDNAVRYAKTIIDIEFKVDKNDLILRIYNDGEKLSQEEVKYMFRPFNKGDKGKYGLGLSIVKEIVELYNAHIFVNNEKKGVAFYIEFNKK